MSNWRTHLSHIPTNVEATLKSLAYAITGSSDDWNKADLRNVASSPEDKKSAPKGKRDRDAARVISSEDTYGSQVWGLMKVMENLPADFPDALKVNQAMMTSHSINKFRGEAKRDLDRLSGLGKNKIEPARLDPDDVKKWHELDTRDKDNLIWGDLPKTGVKLKKALDENEKKELKELWDKINPVYLEWREEERVKGKATSYDTPEYLYEHHAALLAVYNTITGVMKEEGAEAVNSTKKAEAPTPYHWVKKGPPKKEKSKEATK